MGDEPFTVVKTLPSGIKATINATSPEDYVTSRDYLYAQDKCAEALGAVVDDDRNWFKARPKRKYRLRRSDPSEINSHPDGWVLVTRVDGMSGTRMRIPLPIQLVEGGYIDLVRRLSPKKRDNILKGWTEACLDMIRSEKP